jgi:hypothetical protein
MSIDTDQIREVDGPATERDAAPAVDEPQDPAAGGERASHDEPDPADAPDGLVEAAAVVWHNPDLLLEGRVARSAVLGAFIGIVLFTIGIGALGLWAGLDPVPALGLGLFTALWGGLGFGGMLGAVIAINRAEIGR